MKLKKKKVYYDVLEIAKELAKNKEGTLFVIAPKNRFRNTYRLLYPQITAKHYINEKGMKPVLKKLANLDGAILIGDTGEIVAYGAMIKRTRTIPGFGTKHAAAAGITRHIEDSTAILVTEGLDWIKVFQKGKIVVEMDSGDKPPSLVKQVVSFLTDQDTALITTAGASAAILGFAPVMIISGTYLVIKTATGIIKKNLKYVFK
jgi:hypothetical protein